jgi:hypothetical protein
VIAARYSLLRSLVLERPDELILSVDDQLSGLEACLPACILNIYTGINFVPGEFSLAQAWSKWFLT